jgi:hypothetical protein
MPILLTTLVPLINEFPRRRHTHRCLPGAPRTCTCTTRRRSRATEIGSTPTISILRSAESSSTCTPYLSNARPGLTVGGSGTAIVVLRTADPWATGGGGAGSELAVLEGEVAEMEGIGEDGCFEGNERDGGEKTHDVA